jgi:hypothetical protein
MKDQPKQNQNIKNKTQINIKNKTKYETSSAVHPLQSHQDSTDK